MAVWSAVEAEVWGCLRSGTVEAASAVLLAAAVAQPGTRHEALRRLGEACPETRRDGQGSLGELTLKAFKGP